MLDLKFIRQNLAEVKKACASRGSKVNLDEILFLDENYRKVLTELEVLRAGRKTNQKPEVKLDERTVKHDKNKVKSIERGLKEMKADLDKLLRQVPNIPDSTVPIGPDDSGNKEIRKVGTVPKFSFKPKSYLELAERLDLIDLPRAAKVSGQRFAYLKNELVILQFALVKFAMETLVKEGFTPVIPPVMVRDESMAAMGYLDQGGEKETYHLTKDDLYLVGTAEQSIGPMYSDEILNSAELPKRFVGYSTCFRREAGASGKDTKGILRVHQFDKLEMFSFVKPEASKNELELILALQEKLVQALKIPYRVVSICTGDLSFPSSKTYDIECFMPGQNEYRETSSTSNCTDFQARRLKIRFKNHGGANEFVHTLNGTAFAIPRTLIAIIENYQTEEGWIRIPEVLQKQTGFDVIKKKGNA